jgi:hypothetical protein
MLLSTDFPAGKLPAFEEIIDRIWRDSEEFGSHPDIEDLGSPGECDAGPAFFLIFGRHRYVGSTPLNRGEVLNYGVHSASLDVE